MRVNVAGSMLAPHLLERYGIGVVYGAAIALMALGPAGAAVSPDVWVAVVFLVVLGVGNGAAYVYNSLLIQRGTPDAVRGRAFSLVMSVTFASFAYVPTFGGTGHVARVRSPLISVHELPPFAVFHTVLAAKKRRCGSAGEKTTGCVRTTR